MPPIKLTFVFVLLWTLTSKAQANCDDDNTQIVTKFIDHMAVTSGIKDREPVDSLCETAKNSIYFFTDLRQLNGKTVRHQWIHEDYVESEKAFEVGGDRWRVWSRKSLDKTSEGVWILAVLDENDELLAVKRFKYSP